MTFKKGHIPWHKGKTGIYSKKALQKMSKAKKENPTNYWLGKKRPEIKKWLTPFKKGMAPWNKGKNISGMSNKKHSTETIKKMKNAKNKGQFKKGMTPWCKGLKLPKLSKARMGEKNPMWNGGTSFLPYGSKFNKGLKEQIKKRDKYKCQLCYKAQEKLKYLLEVHHIDYNKKNNEQINLISLCKSCHTITNKRRKYWTAYFQNLMSVSTASSSVQ
jgi:hypothetical protein